MKGLKLPAVCAAVLHDDIKVASRINQPAWGLLEQVMFLRFVPFVIISFLDAAIWLISWSGQDKVTLVVLRRVLRRRIWFVRGRARRSATFRADGH